MPVTNSQPFLKLCKTIGFDGKISQGLRVHPNSKDILFSVGCTIVVQNIETEKQEFLSGHSSDVSCLDVSPSGKMIASGQVTHMGFKADVILWDFEQRQLYAKLTLHMVKVEALAFSPNEKYLATLGGVDDGSVVVWDVAKKQAICGSPAQTVSAGISNCVAFSKTNDDVFITGGQDTLRVWTLDLANRKIRPVDTSLGTYKRTLLCAEFSPDDAFFYCGTSTGDVICINALSKHLVNIGPEKKKMSLGVTAIRILKTGDLLLGSGNGEIAVLKGHRQAFKRTGKTTKVEGLVTSFALLNLEDEFFCGTDHSNIYKIKTSNMSIKLLSTCHYAAITDLIFPRDFSKVYITSSTQNIRVWNAAKGQELLRISVPNMTCNAVSVNHNGSSIISGWDDGRIRAFYPESGKPDFMIEDGHRGGVTALEMYNDNKHIVSGGKEGTVRVWHISNQQTRSGAMTVVTKLLFSLEEHKAAVTCIKIKHNDSECVSASSDGTCVIWDLLKRCRCQMIRVNTLFKYVCYHPEEYQLLTTGTDRRIGYWETYDGSAIRELEGSRQGSINCLDISADGMYFVSGGDDKIIKVWTYDEGEVIHKGIGHGAPITRVKISPDQKFIISVSTDGAILHWNFPN